MTQSNAMSYNTHHYATRQLQPNTHVPGVPTSENLDMVLAENPTTNLKRCFGIRRSARWPTSSKMDRSSSKPVPPHKPQLPPLITAFSSSGSVLTRRPTMVEHSTAEWRDVPQHKPKLTQGAALSRRSTVASVYSLPSAAPHASRHPTQENYIHDWSALNHAFQNYAQSPVTASPYSHSPRDYTSRPTPSRPEDRVQRASGRSRDTTVDLSRSNTSQVRTLIMDRQRRPDLTSKAAHKR